MKRSLVAFVAAASLCIGFPLLAQDAEPDLPPDHAGKLDKEAFMRERNEHVMLMRGVPHFQAYDPRLRALEEMRAQEAALELIDPGVLDPDRSRAHPGRGHPEQRGGRIAIAVHPTNPDIVYVGDGPGRRLPLARRRHELDADLRQRAVAGHRRAGARALQPRDPVRRHRRAGRLRRQLLRRRALPHRQRQHDREPDRAHQPAGHDRASPAPTAFTGRAISEILVHPTNAGHDLRLHLTGIGGNPRAARSASRSPPLAMRGVYRSTNATSAAPTFTKLTVDQRRERPAGHDGQRDDHRHRDAIRGNPNVIVAWASTAPPRPDHGGIYRTTNALAATPTFTQTLVTTHRRRPRRARRQPRRRRDPHVGGHRRDGVARARLRRSTDGGATWSTSAGGRRGLLQPQCFYDIASRSHPTTANTVMPGRIDRHARPARAPPTAAPPSRQRAPAPACTPTPTSSPTRPPNPNIVYFGSDGGIWRSNDGGMTWTSLNNTSSTPPSSRASRSTRPTASSCSAAPRTTARIFKQPDGIVDPRGLRRRRLRAHRPERGRHHERDDVPHLLQQTRRQIGFAASHRRGHAGGQGWATLRLRLRRHPNGITCNPTAAIARSTRRSRWARATRTRSTSARTRSTARPTRHDHAGGQPGAAGRARPITTIAISPANDNFRIAGTAQRPGLHGDTTGATTMTDVTSRGHADAEPGRHRPAAAGGARALPPDRPQHGLGRFRRLRRAPPGQHIWKTTNLSGGAATWVAAGRRHPRRAGELARRSTRRSPTTSTPRPTSASTRRRTAASTGSPTARACRAWRCSTSRSRTRRRACCASRPTAAASGSASRCRCRSSCRAFEIK